MTVLVVDDDTWVREYSRDLLEESGYGVHEVSDGEAALAEVQKTMPECIVLDLVMPGLSGFDTLRQLRKQHANLPPVLVLTSMSGNATRAYATTVNKADAYLVKSDIDDPDTGLVAQVRRLTRSR